MSCRIVFVLVVASCLLASASGIRVSQLFRLQKAFSLSPSIVEDQWFVQKLDHFNGADSRTWNQRYFMNDTHYVPGGPIFLMIGGEGPANPAWMQYGTWLTYAEKMHSLCLLLEHRFYGKSHPTEDLSTENLRYLNSEQALADLAHFQTVMAEKMNLTANKWVAFGGSYPGSLAAWYRLKYPHLVHAAVASSAPVHAVVNFPEYLEVVRHSLETYSSECPVLVQNASDTVMDLLKDPKNYEKLSKDFNLCEVLDIDSDMDSGAFLEALAGNFMNVVQYNEDNRAFEGVLGTNITIKVLCDLMAASKNSPYSGYIAVSNLMLATFGLKCLDASYKKFLEDMTNVSWDGPAAGGERQWIYQTCTEFGFYQSTDSPNQPFTGFPLKYHLQQCLDVYGAEFDCITVTNAVQQTNENYGGYSIKSSRIVFPNGNIDPWHFLGITKQISEELPAVLIKGVAHCANMYPARPEDLPQLVSAREYIGQLLQKWLEI
ncbi:putative serine protease K12H4.7 [Protopterus annectens]|uniref:putative serine protease K12H4.7 n=1 Tax=Protopterus annectens TaxID=7888 RepID=UPI001CFAA630|nr:putative serine protease K12H4.7 [Protopterus annectens]